MGLLATLIRCLIFSLSRVALPFLLPRAAGGGDNRSANFLQIIHNDEITQYVRTAHAGCSAPRAFVGACLPSLLARNELLFCSSFFLSPRLILTPQGVPPCLRPCSMLSRSLVRVSAPVDLTRLLRHIYSVCAFLSLSLRHSLASLDPSLQIHACALPCSVRGAVMHALLLRALAAWARA